MGEDWGIDVRKYARDADDTVMAAIVRYCDIALRSVDASLVSFTDPAETDRVRENFLKKKLALIDPDDVLDGAIAAVGARMSGDSTRNRVTAYYLLAEHFGKLGLFGASSDGGVATPAPLMAAHAAPAESRRGVAATAWGDYLPLAVLVVGGLGILSRLGREEAPAASLPPAIVVAAPVAVAEPIPEGAGITTAVVDGEPTVSIYFDTAKFNIYPNFEARTEELRAFLAAHPGDHPWLSGFNDPRGNAAMIAELPKNRAFAVRDALVKLGVPVTSIDLVEPA